VEASIRDFPNSSIPAGIMATVTARKDRPLVVSTFNREQLIGRGHKAMFVTPTLSEVRRVATKTLQHLRGDGLPATVEDLVPFARTRLGVNSTAVDMLRPDELVLRRIITCDHVGFDLEPAPGSLLARVRCGSQFLLVELAPRAPRRTIGFYRDPQLQTRELRFQIAAGGTLVPYLVLPAYFVTQIEQGQAAFDAFYTRERLFGDLETVRSGPPSVQTAIVIGDSSPPAPIPTASIPPAERMLDLTELSTALLPMCILITGESSRTAEEFLAELRKTGISEDILPSPPITICSSTGVSQLCFFPASPRAATTLFHALQDVASTGVSYVSFVPGPECPRYELQQSALVPAAFVALFPTPLAAEAAIRDVLRRIKTFSTVGLALMQQSCREYPGFGQCFLVRVFFPSVNMFCIWLRDFPQGVPITITLPSKQTVCFHAPKLLLSSLRFAPQALPGSRFTCPLL
jgi:hypothetical protein